MTKKLNEYEKMTGEKLRQQHLADPNRRDFLDLSPEERKEALARLDALGARIRKNLADLNNGTVSDE